MDQIYFQKHLLLMLLKQDTMGEQSNIFLNSRYSFTVNICQFEVYEMCLFRQIRLSN